MLRKKCAIALSIVLMFSSISYSPAYAETSESESIVNQEVFTTSTENTGEDKDFPDSELLSVYKDDLEGNVLEGVEESRFENQGGQETEGRYDVSENKSPALDEDYEEAVFDKTVSIDGISVNVYADSGVFPKTARLSVKKILKKADKEKVEVAIDEQLKDEEASLDESIVFDIKILDKDGQELQPDTSKGEVKVNFESLDLSALDENKELAVYHLEDAGSEAKKIEDIKLDAKEASLEVAAEHFSLYVISFINVERKETDTTTIELGETVNLADILRKIVPGGIREAISLDSAIIKIEKDSSNSFTLTALKEGKGRIRVRDNSSLGLHTVDIIIQASKTKGRIGKTLEYVVSGSGNNMTLRISGKGYSDAMLDTPWFPYIDNIAKVIIDEGVEGVLIDKAFADMDNLQSVILPSSLKEISEKAFYGSNKLGNITVPKSVEKIGALAFVKNSYIGRRNVIINNSNVKLYDTGEVESGEEHYASYYTEVRQNNKEVDYSIKDFKINDLNIKNMRLSNTDPSIYLEFSSSYKKSKYNLNDAEISYYLIQTEDANEVISIDSFKEFNGNFDKEKQINQFSSDKSYVEDGESYIVGERAYYTKYRYHWDEGSTYYCYVLGVIGDELNPVTTPIFKKIITVGNMRGLEHSEGNITWKLESTNIYASESTDFYTLNISGVGAIRDYNFTNNESPWIKLVKARESRKPENKPQEDNLDSVPTNLIIHNGITKIGKNAFRGMNIAGDLIIPDTVTEIEEGAFRDTVIGGDIIFSNNLIKIGDEAFSGIVYDKNINLPEGLKSIGSEAFSANRNYTYDNNIDNIIIPSTVTDIGPGAFYKYSMGVNGKNTIINNSNIKLSERHANTLYTNFQLDDSGEEAIPKSNAPNNGNTGSDSGSGSYGGGSGSGGGGGSRGGGSGSGGGSAAKGTGNNRQNQQAPNTSTSFTWVQDSRGWWLKNADNSYPKSTWKQIGSVWYYFNAEGYMTTGWIELGGNWYFMEAQNAAALGSMRTGWIVWNGKWYYLSESGAMMVNTRVGNYLLGADGTWDGVSR